MRASSLRRGLFVLLSLLPAAAALAETPSIQRYLASLRLGDPIETIRKVYPPQRDWPSYREPGGEIVRVTVERAYAKGLPAEVGTMRLGLRRNRLVHLQLIYDLESSRRKPVDELVLDYALAYGEPRRAGRSFWWSDGDTVLRVAEVEVPVLEAGAKASELRTSVELMVADLSSRR